MRKNFTMPRLKSFNKHLYYSTAGTSTHISLSHFTALSSILHSISFLRVRKASFSFSLLSHSFRNNVTFRRKTEEHYVVDNFIAKSKKDMIGNDKLEIHHIHQIISIAIK